MGSPTPTTPVRDAGIYMSEAESGVVDAAFGVAEDPSASGGRYLAQSDAVATSALGTEAASVSIDVEEAGDHTLWVRVWASSHDADAIYLGFDGATRRVFPETLGSYTWLEVERVPLAPGPHRISIGLGEPGLRVDLFAVVRDPSVSGADLERRVVRPDLDPPPATAPRTASMRGDPTFDAAALTGDVALWYGRLLASIDAPASGLDPFAMAARDDLYTYARPLQTYVQSVLVAFRLTGDLRLLDHVDAIAERMRQELRDEWRGTVNGTDGTRDGYLNWVYRASDEPDLMGTDNSRGNEMKTHAMIATIAHALDLNRDLVSPGGRDYGAHADAWLDYLLHHFEAKWRERTGVATGFPIMTRPHTHTYYSWTKWHYYMGLLTGDASYSAEAERMADVLWDELRPIETPGGTAYVWARSILALGGSGDYLHPTTYARYVFGDVVEFHLEGFHGWSSEDVLGRFARTFTSLVIDRADPLRDGFASDIGGGVAQAGIPSDDAWTRLTPDKFRLSSYALIGAWDPTDRLQGVTADVYAAIGSRGGTMLAAGSFLDAWWDQSSPGTATMLSAAPPR